MKRVLLTGSNGLIASKVRECNASNPSVELICTSRTLRADDAKTRFFDLRETNNIQSFLDEAQPEIIIHTAAQTSVDYAEDHQEECTVVNVEVVREIVRWCSNRGARLIHFSTDFVFDGVHGMYKESDVPNALSHYGRTKAESERIVINCMADALVIRTVLVYGYTELLPRLNFPLWVKRELEAGRTIQVTADQFRTPTLADDLAKACLEAALSTQRGLLHLSGPEYMSVFDFARLTASVFGLNPELIIPRATAELNQRGIRPLRTGFNIGLAREVLAYKPLDVRDGLLRMRSQMQN